MKGLLGIFSRTRPADDDKAAATEETVPEATVAAEPSLPKPRAEEPVDDDAIEFELRQPTPEEISATIIGQQDFLDLERMLGGEPTQRRVISSPKAPLLSEAVTAAVRERAQSAQPTVERTSKDAASSPLIGHVEAFEVGIFIGGWVGDPDDPGSRSIRVAAAVDGKEVASTIADYPRRDIPYAGFRLNFPDDNIAALIVEERLVLYAMCEGKKPFVLKPSQRLVEKARSLAPEAQPAGKAAAAVQQSGELSQTYVPVGLESPNGGAIVGRDGFLFSYGGPNNFVARYRHDPARDFDVLELASGWLRLFETRSERLRDRKVAYIQAVMPEKATILNDLATVDLGPITPVLAMLESLIASRPQIDDPAAGFYSSLISLLRSGQAAGISPFQRLDSHMSVAGAQLSFYHLARRISEILPAEKQALSHILELCGSYAPGAQKVLPAGDLARQFGFPMYEREHYPDLARLEPFSQGAPDIADVPAGRMEGMRMVWRNADAPSSLRIVAFGGGAFDEGGDPHGLSWWFRSMFAEFHFLWSAEIDIDYVDQHRPDLVICVNDEMAMAGLPAR